MNKLIKHLRDREYMGGIDRDKLRVKQTNEVFTPTELVQRCLDDLPDQTVFSDPTKTFIDPSCGDGQFLSEVLIRKLENGIDFETALSTIYGVDLMLDNVKLCQDRLLCSRDDLRHIVEQNIVCADALTYHYRFDSTAPDVTDQDLIAKENKVEVVSNIQTPPKKLKAKHTSNTEVLEDLNVEVESNIQKQPRQIKEKPKANPVVLDEYLPSLGPSGI